MGNTQTPSSTPSSAKSPVLRINEIFHSIQGESTRSGEPCVFIRLAGCHLRCSYCDTEYAFNEGTKRSIDDIFKEVVSFECPVVELTGGEPLLQPKVHDLERRLLDHGNTVLIETSGACDLAPCDPRSVIIMDIKTPSSGEADRIHPGNLGLLKKHHEAKFVIGDRKDYEWAREFIQTNALCDRVACVLFSPVFEQTQGLQILGANGLEPHHLAKWILEDKLPVRMQLQIHKFIWDPQTRGV